MERCLGGNHIWRDHIWDLDRILLAKSFTKRNNSKEETVNLADSSDSDSSPISGSNNSSTETGKTSIKYDSDSADYEKISSSSISTKDNNWIDGCRDAFIIYESKTNGKSKRKEHKLSSNNLDKALNYAYISDTLLNPTNKKDKQTKFHKKLKIVHLSPIIFVKLFITAGKKDRQSNIRLVKCLVDSGVSKSVITKSKSDKLPVKNTKQEQQWLTAAGFLTTNNKTEKSFSFPELHANKLINQSIHIVDLNIDCYNMITGCYLISSLGIDIHGVEMTIQWDYTSIQLRNIESTKNNVFALSQYNALFNLETKRMKRIINVKY